MLNRQTFIATMAAKKLD